MMTILSTMVIVLATLKFVGGFFNYWNMLDLLVMILLMMFSTLSINESNMMISMFMNIDTLSFGLVILTVYLFVLMYLSSYKILTSNMNKGVFNLLMVILMIGLIISFLSSNYVNFYIFFEASLIPTLFIILGWGYQPERIQAGVYFMIYTLVGSLPLLVGILYLWVLFLSISMWDSLMLSYTVNLPFLSKFLFGLVLMLAFLIKLPMFMTHLWLPKAHVEAPVAGSMILAGVLLKLGGYGLIRLFNKFLGIMNNFTYFIISMGLVGMIFIGVSCCRLNDFKSLIAYSSVSHMMLVIGGLMTFSVWGINGSLLMMISHGLSSSGLFCFSNIIYERVGSRSLLMSKGVMSFFPLLSMIMFLLCCSNVSAPPSINLLSEILLFISIIGYDKFVIFLLPLGSFLGAVFTFYLFSLSQHGKCFYSLYGVSSIKFIEYHVFILHMLPINFIIVKNDLFSNFL